MKLRTGQQTSDQLDDIVHLDTQRATYGLDLTVEAVFRVTGPGQLDFGGSEFDEAARERISSELADPADDYGWWTLDAGSYLIRYNESLVLDDGQAAQVYPHERLLLAGAHHPAFFLDEPRESLETLLLVGEPGCHLKENCRVSRLLVLDDL